MQANSDVGKIIKLFYGIFKKDTGCNRFSLQSVSFDSIGK